jgi:hypothetical protein
MTTPFPDALAIIKRIVREHPEPKMDPQCLDEMRPSDELFCPSPEFMRDEFFPFWREFVECNEISGGKWFCEGMANFACGVMSQCARIRAEKTDQDYAAAFFKVGIWIYKPLFNGGLESGPHMTNLIILNDLEPRIFEPQNPRLEYVELKEALHSVDLATVAF